MKIKIVAVALTALLLAACRMGPVYNVSEAPIAANVANPSKEDVKKAIMRAGTGLGWEFKDNGPSAMIATLHLRTHTAVVDIPYSATSYSILYKDSAELNYNGTSIHANYNGWVQRLKNGIDAQMKTL